MPHAPWAMQGIFSPEQECSEIHDGNQALAQL